MTRNGSEILGSDVGAQGDNQLANANGLTLNCQLLQLFLMALFTQKHSNVLRLTKAPNQKRENTLYQILY